MRFLSIGPPSILAILGFLCWPESNTFAEPNDSKLAKSDREYLDSLFREFLFDPTGAERVRVKVPDRRMYAWSESNLTARDAWLVKGKKGEPDRVFFMDGFGIPAPPADKIERVDFLEPIKRFFSARQPPDADTGEWVQRMAREVLGGTDCFLPYAAWLHRLGHDDYARQALGLARALSRREPKDDLRETLSCSAFDDLHFALCSRADADALARGEYFVHVFGAKDEVRRPQAEAIIADLKRRREKGGFGKLPEKDWPPGFSKWGGAKKLDYLIAHLEDLAEPGLVGSYHQPFLDDRNVGALIDLGEQVVTALINVIEKDRRLTRYPVRGYKFGEPTGQFHGVGDAAEVAVKSILRVQRFPEVVGEGDVANAQAFRIRKYWDAYGKLPFGERMMTILTDEKAPEHSWREAAANLAKWDHPRRFGLSGGWSELPPSEPRKPNPFVAKFINPTVAEAIVAAMDRDWAIQLGRGPQNGAFHAWPEAEQGYLDHLVALGDRRIAPELDRRAASAGDSGARRHYALAAHRLGSLAVWEQFSRDIERGAVRLESPSTANTEWAGRTRVEVELSGIVEALVQSNCSQAERALTAMTNPSHKYYPVVSESILRNQGAWGHRSPWSSHPFCLVVLRRGLDDMTSTGGRFLIGKDGIEGKARGWTLGSGIPDELADPKLRRENADERMRDVAAMRLNEIVAGLPFYHILQRDPDQTLPKTKEILDLYRGRFRSQSGQERERIGMGFAEPGFIPNIKPLGRSATPADVKSGDAIFELNGKGQTADVELPAWLLLKSDAKKEHPPHGLVVQAEVGPDGNVVYGVIFRHAIRAVRADEVERIEPYAKK